MISLHNNRIAIIPARAGSKRIPQKNIKEFFGVPMIERTIVKLKSFNMFDEIIVTTDCPKISQISINAGALVPFMRQSRLADDMSTTIMVMEDAVTNWEKANTGVEYYCCIYPCTPFLSKQDLIESFDLLCASNRDFAYPVVKYSHPVQRRLRMNDKGEVGFAEPYFETHRTQDLEEFYHDAGQFYWGHAHAWRQSSVIHSNAVGLEISRTRAVDIDNQDDWMVAEQMWRSSMGS